jgi:molybdenum cofactor synthesis domain-containing protein
MVTSAKVFHVLVTPEEARKILAKEIDKIVSSEDRSISSAAGFVASEDVYSTEDVPPFDRSEVDGYAVNHESVAGCEEDSPIELKLVGEIEIGKIPEMEVRKGEAVYLSTGSMIPRGADSVVMVEYTSRRGDRVEVFRPSFPGENIAHTGSDFFVGETLVRRGNIITPEIIAVLASSGIGKIKVMRKMKVGIVSTGNELTDPGTPLRLGRIFDSNAYYFKSVLESTGTAECTLLGTLRDEKMEIENFIESNVGKFEIIISSGSTSAGFHDLLYRVIGELGGKMLFHGLSMKPGKPTFLASFGRTLFVGMPGFPLSAASVLKYVILPPLESAYNFPEEERRMVALPFRLNSEKGKDTVLPAIIGRSGRAYPIFGESGSISRLLYADGFVVLSSRKNFYERDETVPFFPLRSRSRDILFIGSNDPLIERVLFDATPRPTIISTGSWGGVDAIRLGEADAGGIHLLKDGNYNTFLVEEEKERKWVLIRGYSRIQGMISADGTSSFSEIIKRNLIFVNRNKGSGTRDLIDSEMERELGTGFQKETIRGYFWEAKSHAAVAKAVKQGRADVGISIEYYARLLNLKFQRIREENYDIMMQKGFYDSKMGRRFIAKLKRSSRYSTSFPGYVFPENIGEVLS